MAFVTITSQPANRDIVSSLLPVVYNFSELTADTLNVVVQVQVWNGATMSPASQWVDVGGKMRCASLLNNAGYFYINIEDIINPYTDAHVYHQTRLGTCDGIASGTDFVDRTLTMWEYYGNRLFRIRVQREYLDGTSGLITLDPNITDSNWCTGHEGAQKNEWNFKEMMGDWDNFKLGYDSGNTTRGYLFLLNNVPRYRHPRFVVDGESPAIPNQYELSMKTDEDFIYCFFAWDYVADVKNRIELLTYNKSDTLLNTRQFEFDADKDGMKSFMCGVRSMFARNVPNAAEGNTAGSEFENVAYYKLKHDCEQTPAGTWRENIAAPMRINIDRTCKGKGYRRFMWRNQLGGWDTFTSDGKYEESTKIQRDTYQKRIPAQGAPVDERFTSLFTYGKSNWSNQTTKVGKIVSHNLTAREAEWFGMIASSAQVYVKILRDGDLVNPRPIWRDAESFEDWNECDFWTPVIIKTKTIKHYKSTDKYQKIEFQFEYVVNERWGRL